MKILDIALKEEEVVTPNRPVESRSVAPLWIAWGVTGALIAGTVGVGIASYNSDSELDGLKSQRNVTRAELDSKNTQVRTLTVTRNILGGVSILSIGIATYLTIRELRLRGKNQASLAPPTMGALSNVWIGPSSFGVFKQF